MLKTGIKRENKGKPVELITTFKARVRKSTIAYVRNTITI